MAVATYAKSASLAGLDPVFAGVVQEVVSVCRAAGWPLTVLPGNAYRTLEQETQHWLAGKTQLKNPANSKHVQGLAVDFDLIGYDRGAGMALWNALGSWWESYGLRWGGEWGDYGHFEWR